MTPALRSAVTLCIGILVASIGNLACGGSSSAEKPAARARIYVTNQLDNTVSVIDGASHKIAATVRVGVSPAQMAVSPDRKSIYIANTGSNTVSVLNTDNNSVAKTIALPRGSRPIGVALSPSGRYLYTADGGSNRVSVLDTRAGRVVVSVRVGTQPLGVAVAPNGKTVYSANSGSGDVSVIDARTNRVVRAILSLGVDLVRWYRTGGPDSPEQLGAFYAGLALGMVTSAENNTASRVEQAIPAAAISRQDPGPV